MASFVRFVFVILIVGMLVNLGVVLLANAHSQRNQAIEYAQNAQRFKELVSTVAGYARRADIVVEGQRLQTVVDPDSGNTKTIVVESTLLVRQYQDILTHQHGELSVVRIVIPGDRLQAGGVLLDFDKGFSGPEGDYRMLADTQLALFAVFCGEGEVPPANPSLEDKRFNFFPRDRVPELFRLAPLQPQASYFEIKLWQYVWSMLPEMPRDAKLPWISPASGHLKATWLAPAVKAVRSGHTYTAFVGNGTIDLHEDETGAVDLLKVMIDEGRRIDVPDDQ